MWSQQVEGYTNLQASFRHMNECQLFYNFILFTFASCFIIRMCSRNWKFTQPQEVLSQNNKHVAIYFYIFKTRLMARNWICGLRFRMYKLSTSIVQKALENWFEYSRRRRCEYSANFSFICIFSYDKLKFSDRSRALKMHPATVN